MTANIFNTSGWYLVLISMNRSLSSCILGWIAICDAFLLGILPSLMHFQRVLAFFDAFSMRSCIAWIRTLNDDRIFVQAII
jgi:hypothetical protein